MPAQANLPAVPVPSSVKVRDEKEAISAVIVFIEFEIAAVEVPMVFVAVTANV